MDQTDSSFPAGLPAQIDDASAWRGDDMARRADEWTETLDEAELEEIDAACEPWLRPGIELGTLTQQGFPLPNLATRLARMREQLLNGRGFVLWRGLPVERWGRHRCAAAFYGLGAHLGAARSQNSQGHVLGHVRDLGLSANDPNVRIYQTHDRQTFHTDSADIVGLLCLQTARSGGLSALVSSTTLYNELRARRPDLAAELFKPLATDRRGEVPPGARPYFEIPVFNWFAGHLSAIYQRQYIDSAQRFADAPRLSAAQIEALDLLDSLAEDPALHFTMALQPGDMQFLHNHSLLHDRTAFVDWPEPERRRYLLRLWLAPIDARPLPEVFAQRYGSVTPGDRGGVVSADGRLRAALE
ncbi:TauD/TfdA family dioxygenase [Piscinibacter sakaiensis]|uniref:TauD/TfdA family dioxygenase n=1 Tax=Piscinibacter sakaiensis TaxID=1547922 RepID=UPI003AADA978